MELVTPGVFAEHRMLVEEVYEKFTIFFDKHLRVRKGKSHHHKVDDWINKTYKDMNVTPEEKRVLEFFFDTYLGHLEVVQDRQLADAMIRKMFF